MKYSGIGLCRVLAFAGAPGLIALPIGAVLMIGFLLVMKRYSA